MSYRGRNIIAWVVAIAVATVFGRLTRDWSFGTRYAAMMGMGAVLAPAVVLWIFVGPGEEAPPQKRRH